LGREEGKGRMEKLFVPFLKSKNNKKMKDVFYEWLNITHA
jgi:hypothetical protein